MLPKKSFSQNFLRDKSVISRIASSGGRAIFDWIVEIGAGEGVLTDALSEKGARVLAIEFDRDLIAELLRRFPISSNVSVQEADILRTDIHGILREHGFKPGDSWAVFGNIPYAITGKILRAITTLDPAPHAIVLMVQKEVAERIVAKDGKGSMLSLSVALCGGAELLFTVPRTAFFPVPDVESAIIRITPYPTILPSEEREHILRFAKIGFASKRKTLANNFASHPGFSKETMEHSLESIKKNKNARAEELSKDEWVQLFSFLFPSSTSARNKAD